MKVNTLIIGCSGSLGKELEKKYEHNEKVSTYNNNFIEGGINYNAITMDLEKTISDLGRFDHAILLLADKDPNRPKNIPALDYTEQMKEKHGSYDNYTKNLVRHGVENSSKKIGSAPPGSKQQKTDVMDYIKCDVATVNTGMAASMGSILLGAGTKGKRSSLRFSKTMLHQSSGGAIGNIQDARITMNEWEKTIRSVNPITAPSSAFA